MIALPSILTLMTAAPIPVGVLLDVQEVDRRSVMHLLEGVLKDRTRLAPVEIDKAIPEVCRRRMMCMVERRPRGVNLLLLVSVDVYDVEATLIDMEVAELIISEANRTRAGWRDLLENELLDAIDTTVSIPLGGRTVGEAFARLFTYDFRDALESLDAIPPGAQLEITLAAKGATVQIDGLAAGVARSQKARVNVPAGVHDIEIRHPRFAPFSKVVHVPPGALVALDASGAIPLQDYSAVRAGIAWGSVVISLVGIGLLIYESVRPEPIPLCGPFACRSTDDLPPYRTIGYTALFGGIATSLPTFLIGKNTDAPWWQPMVGLSVAAFSFAIAATATGETLNFGL